MLRFVEKNLPPRLSLIIEYIYYRIAQEALNNVAKHSEASLTTVILEDANDHSRMIVEDNGRGFDFAALHQSEEQPGWGLTTMKERAAALGGSVRVESEMGKGTRIITEFRK